MNTRRPSLSDADLDRLLRDCADRLIYPATPDVVDRLLSHLGETSPRTRAWPLVGPTADPLEAPSPSSGRGAQQRESSALVAFDAHRRGLRSYAIQALKLAAAVLAFAIVTALLVLVFRGFDDDGRPAVAPPTETPTVTQQRLYVVSDVYGAEEGFSVQVHGRVRAYDAESGAEVYVIDVGTQVDAVLSPDGSRLYIADISDGGDGLIALDAATGRELWRTTIQDRVHWIMSLGPATLAVSPDNQRLFVYSSDATGITGDASAIPYRVQVFDANSGVWISDIDTTNCPAMLHASPDSRTLYVICQQRSGPMVIDLESGEAVSRLDLPGGVSGTAVSPDGRLLYIVSGGGITVADMDAREIIEQTSLELDIFPPRLLRLIALSPDGSRLFVGLGTDVDPSSAAESSRAIAVFDTATWQELGRITTEIPITGQTLAGAPGEQAVFGVSNAFREGTSIATTASILKLSLGAGPALFAAQEREEVLALIAGRVEVPATAPSDATPPATSQITLEPEPGWQVVGSVKDTTMVSGDVQLQIEAAGADDQLELMWFVSTGRCAVEGDERLRNLYPSEVLLRRNPDDSGPGYQQVELVLEKAWLSQPLMVGAFLVGDGDGPVVLCGDVPLQGE